MKNRLALVLMLAVILPSCLKDDLDPASLTTNPLDEDYDGPALIVPGAYTVNAITDMNGDTISYDVLLVAHVRTELLPPLTSWIWTVNGETGTNQGMDDYVKVVHQAVNGSTYCFDCHLTVEFYPTKSYTICTTATW